jgi:hypothetical protein
MTPIFLESYDVFEELKKWCCVNRKTEKRHWTISAWQEKFYACSLTWRFQETQIGSVSKVADNPQEAVHLAIEEFTKWEKSNA